MIDEGSRKPWTCAICGHGHRKTQTQDMANVRQRFDAHLSKCAHRNTHLHSTWPHSAACASSGMSPHAAHAACAFGPTRCSSRPSFSASGTARAAASSSAEGARCAALVRTSAGWQQACRSCMSCASALKNESLQMVSQLATPTISGCMQMSARSSARLAAQGGQAPINATTAR
jgi:hypothetical protein